jgi:hypothetical protein
VTCGTTVARARRGKTPSGPSWAERPDGLGPVSKRPDGLGPQEEMGRSDDLNREAWKTCFFEF